MRAKAPEPRLPGIRKEGEKTAPRVESGFMPYAGDDVSELEARQEPRLVRALEMVAPGTAVREGLDSVVQARTGALLCIGESEELSFLLSGGVRLDVDYTPALLYQLAKMDGAIILSANATKILWANVQLLPDPKIMSLETGTRHRTAERVSKQTDALVIAISQARSVVSLYLDGAKYILEEIPVVLAKANQALATLDKYRSRLDQVSTRLTALEFEGGATLTNALKSRVS
jgi:diadenylate cyclase